MSQLNTGPKASSTTVKSLSQRSIRNQFPNTYCNNTFSSMFSDELTDDDLVKKTFTDISSNKNNIQTESMYSTLSGQSSLGILELDNMSDIGNTYKRETFSTNSYNQQSILEHRLSQASRSRDTLSRANLTTQLKFPFENEVNDKSARTSLININNAFENMLKEESMINCSTSFGSDNLIPGSKFKENFAEIEEANRKEFDSLSESRFNFTMEGEKLKKESVINSSASFGSDNFISGSEFKENLAEIEEINRKEFGSLSESRFNFTLEGEKQSIGNGSFAAKYFATKSVPVEDLSSIFPTKQNKKNVSFRNMTFTNECKGDQCSFLSSSIIKKKEEEEAPIDYNTMPSITSWTDSNVSNNLLNLTTLSEISEVLTSKTNIADPKHLTKALLSGDLSDDKLLNETNNFLQRRLSTSTRFSIASQNLELAELSFPSLDNFSSVYQRKKSYHTNEINKELNKTCDLKLNDENGKKHSPLNFEKKKLNECNKKQSEMPINKRNYFILTPKSGYFEDCTLETKILESSINISNFTILTNNHDVNTEMILNRTVNVSKIVHCNETLCQDEINQSHNPDYRTMSQVLEIGNICIGTYCQAIITLENCLNIEAKYTLTLLNVSHNYTKNNMFVENKPIGKSIATVLCSNKICIIPALSEASFTIGIIPLIYGIVNIHIKLESNDISQEIYRNIQIHSMEPQLTWINNTSGSIDFGLLPELSRKSFPIKLLNRGTSQVPVKFILNQDHCEDVVQAKAIINPSELWQCDVNISTPGFTENNCKIKLITGRLQIVLDSVEELSPNYSPLLYNSNLVGQVGFTSISFNQNPLVLQKNGHNIFNGAIEVYNNSELPISLIVQQKSKQCSELTIQPQQFQLSIKEKIKLKIVYRPSKSFIYFNETSICFQVLSSKKQFFLKTNCVESNFEYQQISSPSSRPVSPWSTSSSSAVGQLELESTCSSLIWGSVPSNTKSVQTFTLRNRGSHKEKLLLSIRDNKNCFKLISSGENQVSEMKLLLEPMESQKLSVALISTSNEGHAFGQLVLQRQQGNEKRAISLFGYCGHSVVTIHGTFEDNFGNMWLYPNAQLMTAKFSVANHGNTTAFIKICQDNSSEDIIEPNEFLLKKGETTTVEIEIHMSPERLEMLIQQDSNSKVININKISLIYGDEVSRVRITRLWNKMKNEKRIVYPDQQRLDEISSMFNGVKFANVDNFADSEKSLVKLWKTDISEDCIVVLMEKSNLESLLCDATTVFSELDTTVISRLS